MPAFAPTAERNAVLTSRLIEHLCAVVAAMPLQREPFDHLVLDGVFPTDVYAQLLAMLPGDGYYRELRHSDALLPDGRSARLQFPLQRANIARLPPPQREFWSAVSAALHSPRVVDAYRQRFADVLRQSGREPAALRLRPYLTLFRDLGGYRISIHPDSPRKAITTQFYLPADESQLHLGTLFHQRRADGSFDEGRAMRFAPNTGYAFAVCAHSWHSVNPMRAGDLPRNSLMIIINHDRGPLIEGLRWLRATVRGWFDRTVRPERGEGSVQTM